MAYSHNFNQNIPKIQFLMMLEDVKVEDGAADYSGGLVGENMNWN